MQISSNSYSYSSSSYKNITTQRISKPSEAELQSSQKILGYEVDENGYFKSDFNKVAGIPEDFKIHSDTMKSMVNINDNCKTFHYHKFKKIDIAKTAGNAYKILTQIMDKDTLEKDKFTRDDLKAMPQGYTFNRMTMEVTKVQQTAIEHMNARWDKLPENHEIITTFFNHSVLHYWDTPEGGKLKPATDIFNNNVGGKENLYTNIFFNSHGEKYTNSDGSITKGGILVGIMNENYSTREGETTWQGKLAGADKNISFKQAQMISKIFFESYDLNASKIPDSVIESLPKDFGEYVATLKKNHRVANGVFINTDNNTNAKNKPKSTLDILYEQMKENEKALLQSLQKKALETKLEENQAAKAEQKALLEELRKQSNKTLNDFTDFFLEVQNNLNRTQALHDQFTITKLELQTAFSGMFDFNQKSFLDLSV